MSIVKRYFHIRPSHTKTRYNGATVLVIGDTEQPHQVDVQTVFCSRKDMFCRKTGRDLSAKAPLKIVPLRYLPNELAHIEDTVHGYALDNSNDFLFAMRYFLPKE